MELVNTTQSSVISSQVEVADTVLSRLKGLLGRDALLPEQAMVITQCRSIHMFFMKFSIDVLFVDRRGKVIGLVHRIKPFRLSPYYFRAAYAVELPAGKIAEKKIGLGDEIMMRPHQA